MPMGDIEIVILERQLGHIARLQHHVVVPAGQGGCPGNLDLGRLDVETATFAGRNRSGKSHRNRPRAATEVEQFHTPASGEGADRPPHWSRRCADRVIARIPCCIPSYSLQRRRRPSQRPSHHWTARYRSRASRCSLYRLTGALFVRTGSRWQSIRVGSRRPASSPDERRICAMKSDELVIVALSGGVDSAVSAMLLRDAGHRVEVPAHEQLGG